MAQHTLPDLPYVYDAVELYINEGIMTLHHKKRHQTYVNALNSAGPPSPTLPSRKRSLSLLRSNSTEAVHIPLAMSDLTIDRNIQVTPTTLSAGRTSPLPPKRAATVASSRTALSKMPSTVALDRWTR